MDSQTLGVVAAAIITALAGLGGAVMSRRTPYRREQLQHMREEAELLALLPEDHPMRDRLSNLLAIRIRGYGRVFEVETLHPRRSWPYAVLAVSGTTLFIVVILTGGWTTIGQLFEGVLSGREITDRERQSGLGWCGVVIVCVAMYFVGMLNLIRRDRERVWAHAMQPTTESSRSTLAEMAQALNWLLSHVASVCRGAWSRLWRRGGREPVNDDPRGSEPDA